MEPSRVIYEATTACLRSFTDCLAVETLMKDEWAENRLADFNLWVSGVGACSSNRASLDARLALKREARDVIANLLHLLAGEVDECKEQGLQLATASSGTPNLALGSSHDETARGRMASLSLGEAPARSFSPWSDDSSSGSCSDEEVGQVASGNPLRGHMQNVEKMLDQLARIGIAVRKSGVRSRLQKADQRFQPKEHEDLERHLVVMFLTRLGSLDDQLDRSRLSPVHWRLIRCNLKRRNRFIYAQQHSAWLNPDAAISPYQTQRVERTGPPPKTGEELVSVRQGSLPTSTASVGERVGSASINLTLRTGTSASAVSDSLAVPQALMSVRAASTIMSSTIVDLEYPYPPKTKPDARVFTCPCCCQTLPVAFSRGNRWKKHVAEDVCPYTCVLPECTTPDVLFTLKENWLQHLVKEHRSSDYWICFICGDGVWLGSEDDFIAHTERKHTESVPQSQIPALMSLCKHSAPVRISCCPLCGWHGDEDRQVDRDVLLDHIAKEVHAFSLRALPWADDNGQENDERIEQSSEKVHDWLVRSELTRTLELERPSLEKKTYASNYFPPNPYFGDGSGASSSSNLDSVASREAELQKWTTEEGPLEFGGSTNSDSEANHDDDDDDDVPTMTDDEHDAPFRDDVLNEIVARMVQDPSTVEADLRLLLQRRVVSLGRNHPETLSVLYHLGGALLKMSNFEEAETIYSLSARGRLEILGPSSPYTNASIAGLELSRYERSRDKTNLMNAHVAIKEAISEFPNGYDYMNGFGNLPGLLYRFGQLFSDLFEREHNLNHLLDAIMIIEDALRLTKDFPEFAHAVDTHAQLLLVRFDHEGEIETLEYALTTVRFALRVESHRNRSSLAYAELLKDVGKIQLAKFVSQGDVQELESFMDELTKMDDATRNRVRLMDMVKELSVMTGPYLNIPVKLPSGTVEGRVDSDSSTAEVERDRHFCQKAMSPNYFKTFFVEERVLQSGGRGVVLLVRHEIDGCSLGHFACKRIPVGDDRARVEKRIWQHSISAGWVTFANIMSRKCLPRPCQ
ncbi:WD repeat-containing protein 88, variant 2 [Purpureocillium takamizusanense]|uniref:WD repeat-containing protein 88, variant 2 n=1 Tax=Purpureocillium takamizusanense TaxID=2060973 RepID=A0A9Q8VBU6_9HYPO|nr:WD repeat-containing protein 88, variant 2 [Purpureocillium takamizusanense]UNI20028.1 WD repeat-containing protein 88, variant 2 [Purpureocillium takamizusanense]